MARLSDMTDDRPTFPEATPALSAPRRRHVNWRSVTLGLVGVVFVSSLAAYNDFAVNNTYLVGNYLPLGLLLLFMTFVLLVNGPLSRWRPQLAMDSGELAVALGMVLIGCTVPTSGLMRYLPSSLVVPYALAGGNSDWQRMLEQADLPDWIYPRFGGDTVRERFSDPLVQDFSNRRSVTDDSFLARLGETPWAPWLRPALAWGALLVAFYGAMLCAAVIVRRQWAENERLPFPLASVYLSLIESPPKGRALNALFASRAFWVAFSAVFLVHAVNALHQYAPGRWPEIPLKFDLSGILADDPWRLTEPEFKAASLFLTIVGISYFLQSNVVFSLWFFYILYQVARMVGGVYQRELTLGMEKDQILGAVFPFALMILWIGRQHWAMVARQMVRGPREGEPAGRYLSYRAAGWGLVAGLVGMVAWLMAAGVTLVGAVVLVGMVMTMMLVVARVVAETGLLYLQVPAPTWRPWIIALNDLPGPLAYRAPVRDVYFSGWFHFLFTHDTRESFGPFATHALRVADDAAYPDSRSWRGTANFVAVLVLALVVAFVAGGAGMLYTEYAHANSMDPLQETPLNKWGADTGVRMHVMTPPTDFVPPNSGPRGEMHSRVGWFAFGATLTAALSVLRLRFVAWPLHPVGYLLAFSWPMKMIWFSLFVGWVAKVLLVRFGGVSLYRAARPVFIGLILGDAGAAAVWLVVALVRNAMGLQYHSVRLFPP